MADSKKTLLKEISLWKRRVSHTKRALSDAYKDISKDAKKAYKEATK